MKNFNLILLTLEPSNWSFREDYNSVMVSYYESYSLNKWLITPSLNFANPSTIFFLAGFYRSDWSLLVLHRRLLSLARFCSISTQSFYFLQLITKLKPFCSNIFFSITSVEVALGLPHLILDIVLAFQILFTCLFFFSLLISPNHLIWFLLKQLKLIKFVLFQFSNGLM